MQAIGQESTCFDPDEYAQSWEQVRRFRSQAKSRTVEALALEVIRRLAEGQGRHKIQVPTSEQIESLCHALICEDDQAGAQFIRDTAAEGATAEVIYLDYLAPAARLLGHWWNEDHVTFLEVTLGTGRMYAIMHTLRRHFVSRRSGGSKLALFTSVPGEEHTLGVRMAADLFGKDGWTVELRVGLSHDELLAATESCDPFLVGVSAGGKHALEGLARLVLALQMKSPKTLVFVGGNIVQCARKEVEAMGVDGMAADMDGAGRVIASLWERARVAA